MSFIDAYRQWSDMLLREVGRLLAPYPLSCRQIDYPSFPDFPLDLLLDYVYDYATWFLRDDENEIF